MVKEPTTTTYALLGLLAVRSWTGYELTQQARRSLRYAWPSSEAHLYREQKLLVRLGWATVRTEPVGRRTRNRYTITPAGRRAFRAWLKTSPQPPTLEVEVLLRMFFAEHDTPEALIESLRTTTEQVHEAMEPMARMVEDYLATGGPFPERLHLIAMTADLVTDLLTRIERFSTEAIEEVGTWENTKGLGLTADARARLERILERLDRPVVVADRPRRASASPGNTTAAG